MDQTALFGQVFETNSLCSPRALQAFQLASLNVHRRPMVPLRSPSRRTFHHVKQPSTTSPTYTTGSTKPSPLRTSWVPLQDEVDTLASAYPAIFPDTNLIPTARKRSSLDILPSQQSQRGPRQHRRASAPVPIQSTDPLAHLSAEEKRSRIQEQQAFDSIIKEAEGLLSDMRSTSIPEDGDVATLSELPLLEPMTLNVSVKASASVCHPCNGEKGHKNHQCPKLTLAGRVMRLQGKKLRKRRIRKIPAECDIAVERGQKAVKDERWGVTPLDASPKVDADGISDEVTQLKCSSWVNHQELLHDTVIQMFHDSSSSSVSLHTTTGHGHVNYDSDSIASGNQYAISGNFSEETGNVSYGVQGVTNVIGQTGWNQAFYYHAGNRSSENIWGGEQVTNVAEEVKEETVPEFEPPSNPRFGRSNALWASYSEGEGLWSGIGGGWTIY